MAEKYKLSHFNVRGVAEPIRLTFVYAGVEYEDNRIEVPDWPAQKKNYFWGKVPVLEVGDKTLNESKAISRFLGQKFGLVGESDWEAAKMDELVDIIYDLREEYRTVIMEKSETIKEKLTREFTETIAPKYLSKLEAMVASNEGDNSIGKKLSWADFQVATCLEWFMMLQLNIDFDEYHKLQGVMETVFKIPEIKKYLVTRPHTMY